MPNAHENEQTSLFAAVDALLEEAAAQDALPHPDERKRLREAAGLSQDQIAQALAVRRETVTSWETGRTAPRPPKRAAYARLLNGLADLHGINAVNAPAPQPAPPHTTSGPINAVNTPQPAAAPQPAAEQVAVPKAAAAQPASPQPATAQARAEGAGPTPTAPVNGVNAVNSTPHTVDAGPEAAPHPGPGAEPQFREGAGRGAAPQGPPTHPHAASPTPHPQPTAPRTTPRTGAAAPTPAPEGNGPLAVLDGTGKAHAAHGTVLTPPTTPTLPALVEWALSPAADLRSPRLHRNGKDGDPLLVLTPAATEALGLPLVLEDRRGLRLPDDHPVIKQLTKAKWQLTRRGFGPWPRIYRPATPTTGRQCVQFAILPWGALDPRAWGEHTADLPAPELAELLTSYATRVLTPRGSTAVSGLELMTALRPPTRAARDESTNTWVSAPVPGSLTRPVDPAPPEAPDEHPVVAALYPRSHQRTPDQVLDEEAYDWIRDPQLLTDAECTRTHAVGIDVNMAFAAAANRLLVGTGPAVHTDGPRFDPKLPGSWLVDLSAQATAMDPRLPSPFTPHGRPPIGPAWYATPTLAYAQELGLTVRPTEAWLRPEHGPYLDSWYTRLRDAYMATMAELGVHASLTDSAFLQAMAEYKGDPDHPLPQTAVLSAIKSTVKGGIGKLRERPQGAGYRPGESWPALERPTWRPDIRAAVISTARVNMHRKMQKLATSADLYPIAVLSDCAVYLSDGPSPLDFLPRTPEGKPLPGGFRLGVNPGMVKHEGTQPLLWAVQLLDERHNPARHIKGHDAAADGE
ncbi:telomere-associated protein Tap [Streptomyces sp. NBC_01264]|uniref:telomere-associated protein Tap n=1 Tax=Streptomyces sp. NBC_01264 TaxID=2903804 RepID=UPI00224E2094|nr:helix-turn-helix domain-containing protein [Streptomyces sp. NBC_01264]MCX4783856.1 helix-turn-helix domain-containing protein [Streptomyces sp. NBC_01264]